MATTKSYENLARSRQDDVPSSLLLKEDQKTVLLLRPPGKGSAALELSHLLQVRRQL